jgi:hypothetical protein
MISFAVCTENMWMRSDNPQGLQSPTHIYIMRFQHQIPFRCNVPVSNPRAAFAHLAKHLQQGKGNRMLFLPWRPPQGPAAHGLQNSFQAIIEKDSSLEFTVAHAAFRMVCGEPDRDPALDTRVVSVPRVLRSHTRGHGFPMDRRQGNAFIQKMTQEGIWFSDHWNSC